MHLSNEYAAGFFDGEGTVYAATRNNPGRPSPILIVAISNTVLKPLALMRDKWGGSIFTDPPRENRQACHQWTLAPRNAYKFLYDIQPYLLIKDNLANTAIEMCELMQLPRKERVDYSNRVYRNGRYWVSPTIRPEFEDKIIALHNRIKQLNSKPFSISNTVGPNQDALTHRA